MTTTNEKTILTYAVVQDGYCVFGTGSTADEAYEDAVEWLDPRKSNGKPYTAEMIQDECDKFQFHGDLRLICRDNNERRFDSYLFKQGGFTLTDDGWVEQ